jgi:hypothetical protein
MRIWRRIARSLGLHHSVTREDVIREYVTLEIGRPCTEFRRAESERLLRAQPYLALAHVRTVADARGGVRVEVQTVDEVPVVLDARLRRGQPAAFTAGNENVLGLGVHAEARIERGFAYRDGFGGMITHYHFLGRPYVLELDGQRDPIGGYWATGLGHPFLTDLQRIAWHAGFQSSDRVSNLTRGGDSFLGLSVWHQAWDVGGVLRLGPPGQLWLLGGVVTGERSIPADNPVLITREGQLPAPPLDRPLPYAPHRATRLNVVTGIRALDFVQARGFDALTATQDIARGVQVGLIAGRGMPSGGDDDLLLAGSIFAGMGTATSYFGLQMDGEGRYDNATAWDGVIGSGRVAWYYKPAPAWTTLVSVEGAGGWRVRVPFNLRLDDRQGGIRADIDNRYLGTRRVVGRVEERWSAGSLGGRSDLGFAGFVELGRLWKGDAPFGEAIPRQLAVGISILGATPPGAQRLARLDIAVPVGGPANRIVEFRFSIADWTRAFWREPREVARARSGAVLAEIFSWP